MAIRASRRGHVAQSIWPPVLTLALILALTFLLGERYRFFPVWAMALFVVTAVVLESFAVYAEKRDWPSAWTVTAILVTLITTVVVVTLVNLVSLIVEGGEDVRGWSLLASAAQVWFSNVLVFGLWYWLLDRGGPHQRAIGVQGRAEFLFPEMTAGEAAKPGWAPDVIEYMYVAFTNATAFSPTDTLPLSSRVRILMAVESMISLATIALVAARAVNILQ